MRVITGTARSRRLETLSGESTRPTTEKVKESIFSAIAFDIEGRRVLDLFAGSGQLGIEALSRGATHCIFVDSSREAVAVIRRNLQHTALSQHATVECRDVSAFLSGYTGTADLVFLDPPYASGQLPACMERVADIVAKGGIVLCESDKETDLAERFGGLCLARTYRYGRVTVRLYRKE